MSDEVDGEVDGKVSPLVLSVLSDFTRHLHAPIYINGSVRFYPCGSWGSDKVSIVPIASRKNG